MGKIQFDHTGSGGGITLSSDGTSLLLGGTAIGGGGADLYAANESSPSAQPSATGANAIAIGDSAVANNTQNVAIGHSADATTGTYNSAFGAFATANASYYAVAIGSDAGGNASTAGGNGSFASSGGVTAGNQAQALGKAYASGVDSFAAAIANNSSTYGAQGANSVAIGQITKATGTNSIMIGKYGHASGLGSLAIDAATNNASGTSDAGGTFSIVIGSSAASEQRSIAFGHGAKSTTRGKIALSTNQVSLQGDTQAGIYILRRVTTDATATALTTEQAVNTPSTVNQINLPNNTAYAFHGTIVGRQQASGGTACAAWKIEGLIRREGSAGTTTLVNSATTVLDNTPSWGMALSADTTNGCLKIEVTGAASTNIRWVATIHTSEVTYA